MGLYTKLFRRLLFQLDAETAHHAAIQACRLAGTIPGIPALIGALHHRVAPELRVEIDGLTFENPIGLAAGWDKNGQALRILERLGFGSIEIGSVSSRCSLGNPKPRLFRLPLDKAIVVNYGLPNHGAEVIAQRIARHKPRVPLGINIVKTNDGPAESLCDATAIFDDYFSSVEKLHALCDYVVLNLSCPNVEVGRDFFESPGTINQLLSRLSAISNLQRVYLKVPPNPEPRSLDRLIEETSEYPFVRGFHFNLPTGKPASLVMKTPLAVLESMPGAVSGKPVSNLINRCIRELYHRMPPNRYSIIAAGGVSTAEDAYTKIRLGASLLQVYTALIYEGPGVLDRILSGLIELLRRDGFTSIQQAIGTADRSS